MIRTVLRIFPMLLLLAAGILLLEGSPILTQPLLEGLDLPMGTLIAWLGISMLPLSILLGIRYIRKPTSRVYRRYKRIFTSLTLLGACWGVISFLLAGNWSFSFSGKSGYRGSDAAFDIFIAYTAFVLILSLLTFMVFLIHHLILILKQKQ